MVKEHRDLQHQIDHFMSTTRNNHCPFSKIEVVEGHMFELALVMEWLHNYGIIHHDLKASNVLCSKLNDGWNLFVIDFECSIGVIGQGSLGLLEYCKHAWIIVSMTSLNCL